MSTREWAHSQRNRGTRSCISGRSVAREYEATEALAAACAAWRRLREHNATEALAAACAARRRLVSTRQRRHSQLHIRHMPRGSLSAACARRRRLGTRDEYEGVGSLTAQSRHSQLHAACRAAAAGRSVAREYEATEALAAAYAARRCVRAASSQIKPGKSSLSWLDFLIPICHARFQKTVEG